MSYTFSAVIVREDAWYIAKCLENNIASQGRTIEEALANLKEALTLYYEDEPIGAIKSSEAFLTTVEVTV